MDRRTFLRTAAAAGAAAVLTACGKDGAQETAAGIDPGVDGGSFYCDPNTDLCPKPPHQHQSAQPYS